MPGDILVLGDNVEGYGIAPEALGNAANYPSWSWFDDEGLMLACAGMVPLGPGRVQTWAFVSPLVRGHLGKRYLLEALRERHRAMSLAWPFNRAESDVRADFRDGHALARLVGYRREVDMVAYGPGGETHTRYIWIAKEHL